MTGRWRLHSSHLSMLSRCAEQFRRRYIEDEIIPPGIALLVGSGTHTGIETDLETKINTGDLAEEEEVKAAARDRIHRAFNEGNVWVPPTERDEWKPEQARDEAVDTATGLASLHHNELAPELWPVAVERPWVVTLKHHPFDLAGRIDIEEPTRLRDTKTKSRKPSSGLEHTMLQPTMYSLAKWVCDKERPEEFYVDWLVKTKTPHIESRSTTRGPEDFKALLRRIEAAWQMIEAGSFPPTNPDDWCCSPKYCGYYESCPYVRNPSVHQVKKGNVA